MCEKNSNYAGFVAVHVGRIGSCVWSKIKLQISSVLGAGIQSQARFPRYRETIKKACLQAIKTLNSGKYASEAVCLAVAVLEVIQFERMNW